MVAALAPVLITGSALVAVDPAAAATPSNDDFADARLIDADVRVLGSTVDATSEPGEPSHAPDQPPGRSIWYRYTISENSTAQVYSFMTDSSGEPVPHAVAVYTGTALSNLKRVAGSASGESVRLHGRDAQDYYIAISGNQGRAGSVVLFTGTKPVNDRWWQALPLSGLSDRETGSNRGANHESEDPALGVVAHNASVWYRWVAPVSGRVTVHAAGITLDPALGARAPLVRNPHWYDDWESLGSNDDCAVPEGTLDSCVSFDAVRGRRYYVAVGGSTGGEGVFDLWWQYATDPCTITGTAGDDTLTGTPGPDVVCGLGGDDRLQGQAGDDALIGGAGADAVSYADAGSGIVADLETSSASGQGSDLLSQVENLVGSPYADQLVGGRGSNVLNGGAGADDLVALGGRDTLYGAGGDDVLRGGWSGDRVNGGPGTDTASYFGPWPITVDLGAGTTSRQGGSDSLIGIEDILGSGGGDRIVGSAGANRIDGSFGADVILGVGGDDDLLGAQGDDSLTGGAGADRCDGGEGIDTAATCESITAVP